MPAPSLDEYVDVAERLVDFHARYPEGTLQTIDWSVAEVGERLFIVYRAAAYRTPNDPRPAHGTAWEPFPGTTPYTRNSELMNAETAAWGRAIVACGLTANRKLASRQEVRARVEEQASEKERPPEDKPEIVSDDTLAELRRAYKAAKINVETLRKMLGEVGVEAPDAEPLGDVLRRLSEDQATWLVLRLREHGREQR